MYCKFLVFTENYPAITVTHGSGEKNPQASQSSDTSVEIRKMVTRTYGKPRIGEIRGKSVAKDQFDEIVGDNLPLEDSETSVPSQSEVRLVKEDMNQLDDVKEGSSTEQGQQVKVDSSHLDAHGRKNQNDTYTLTSKDKTVNRTRSMSRPVSSSLSKKKLDKAGNSKINLKYQPISKRNKSKTEPKIFRTRNKEYAKKVASCIEESQTEAEVDDDNESQIQIVSKRDQEANIVVDDPYAFMMSQRTPKQKNRRGKSVKRKREKAPLLLEKGTEIKSRTSSREKSCKTSHKDLENITQAVKTPVFQFSQENEIDVDYQYMNKGQVTKKTRSKKKTSSDYSVEISNVPSTQDEVQALIDKISDAENFDLTTMSQFQREERRDKVFPVPSTNTVKQVTFKDLALQESGDCCDVQVECEESSGGNKDDDDDDDTGMLIHRDDSDLIKFSNEQAAVLQLTVVADIHAEPSDEMNESLLGTVLSPKQNSVKISTEKARESPSRDVPCSRQISITRGGEDFTDELSDSRQSYVLAEVTNVLSNVEISLKELNVSGAENEVTVEVSKNESGESRQKKKCADAQKLRLSKKQDKLQHSHECYKDEEVTVIKNTAESCEISKNDADLDKRDIYQNGFDSENTSQSVSLLPQGPPVNALVKVDYGLIDKSIDTPKTDTQDSTSLRRSKRKRKGKNTSVLCSPLENDRSSLICLKPSLGDSEAPIGIDNGCIEAVTTNETNQINIIQLSGSSTCLSTEDLQEKNETMPGSVTEKTKGNATRHIMYVHCIFDKQNWNKCKL